MIELDRVTKRFDEAVRYNELAIQALSALREAVTADRG